MKKQPANETDKDVFFRTLKRAALPLSPTDQKKSAAPNDEDCNDKQTRSHSSASAAGKRGGKSR